MKEVRVAIIGFGGIARSHLKGYQILSSEGEVYSPTLPKNNYMAEEIRTFAKTILDDSFKNLNNPPESARETVRLVEKLRESAAQNGALVKNID